MTYMQLTIVFLWEMLPVLLPLLLLGTFIIGSLGHYIQTEIKLRGRK